MSPRISRLKSKTKPKDEYSSTYQQLTQEEETLPNTRNTNDEYSSTYQQLRQEEEETLSNTRKSNDEINGNDDDYDIDEPVWTFRVLLLGLLSFIFLIIVTKYYLRETSECVMSMVWVTVFMYPIGFIMAKKLPKRKIYLRPIGLEFALNPGAFNKKEYAMISIIGNIGAVYGGLTSDFIFNASF
ncbi:hypothetical protein FXO38_33697 [Capsicum annuum]|uniref:Oligopeptide transporter 2-like n=1 Tax=Capsicum annuum TaxID=4072 RepID=A0A2G2YK64_CAPAN|nr:hypothetical protein FXO38_33697 [Capsicum annuum]PHT70128.1 hypothetical protein T459_25232 [Capsicum annuum]